MTSVFAIALPVVLALMGIAVSLEPPATTAAAWICFAAFIVIGLFAIVAGIRDRRNNDATQAEFKKTIDGLKDSIDKFDTHKR